MSGFDFGLDRLVIGLFTGLTYGLLAVGLVLVYRSSRFVNFAHGSVGAFGASVLALFVADWGAPYWVAFVLAIIVGALLSGVIEVVVVRRLEGRPSLVGMIATLGLSQLILVMSLLINSDGVSGFTYPKPTHLPTFEIQSLPIGTPYVAMLVLAPVLLAVLGWFLRHHRMGIAIRAAADDPDTARLEGIPARWMATLAWAIAGGIAAFSAILVTPTTAGAGMEGLGPDLLLKGLAGAVIARMSSIPIAIVASLGIGVIEQMLLSNPDTRGLVTVVIALIIVIALLRQPQLGRSGQDKGRWRRVVLPPLPEAYRSVRSIVWLPAGPGRGRHRRRRRPGLRRQQRHGVGAHAGRRLHARRAQRRPAHRCLRPALARPVRVRRHRRRRVGARRRVDAQLPLRRAVRRDLGGHRLDPGRHPGDDASRGSPSRSRRWPSRWRPRPGCCARSIFLGDGISPAKPTWWNYPLEYAVDYYLFALLMLCLGRVGDQQPAPRRLRPDGAGAARQRGRGARVHGAQPDADAAAVRRLRCAGRPRRHRDRPRPVAADGQLVPGRRQHRRRRGHRHRRPRP